MGNDNQFGLLVLNQGGDVVEAELEDLWLGLVLDLFTVSLSLGLILESLSLLSLSLWHVLRHHGEESLGLVLVHGVGELVDGTWGWESLLEHLLLSKYARLDHCGLKHK